MVEDRFNHGPKDWGAPEWAWSMLQRMCVTYFEDDGDEYDGSAPGELDLMQSWCERVDWDKLKADLAEQAARHIRSSFDGSILASLDPGWGLMHSIGAVRA